MRARHTLLVGFRATDDDVKKIDEIATEWGDIGRSAVMRKAIRVLYELEYRGGSE